MLNPVQQRLQEGGSLTPSVDTAAEEIGKLIGTDEKLKTDAPSKRDSAADDSTDALDEPGGNTDVEDPPVKGDLEPEDEDDSTDDGTGGDDDDDGDGKVDATAEDDDTDAVEGFDSLEGLAEALEVSVDDLSALNISFKAAGEDQTVTLEELTKGYARQADYDRGKNAIAEQQRAFETEKANAIQEVQRQAAVAGQLLSHFEQHFQAARQDPKLAELRTNDPAEWSARVQEIDQQLAAVNNVRQAAALQYEQFQQDSHAQFLAQEAQRLQQEVPEWGEDKLRLAVDTVKSLGFSDDEVVSIAESRLIKGVLELADLRAENAALKARVSKGEQAAKTVKRTVPKTLKAGKTSKTSVRRDGLDKARSALKKSGNIADAAKVIEALGDL